MVGVRFPWLYLIPFPSSHPQQFVTHDMFTTGQWSLFSWR